MNAKKMIIPIIVIIGFGVYQFKSGQASKELVREIKEVRQKACNCADDFLLAEQRKSTPKDPECGKRSMETFRTFMLASKDKKFVSEDEAEIMKNAEDTTKCLIQAQVPPTVIMDLMKQFE
jgi:hypothetical protein